MTAQGVSAKTRSSATYNFILFYFYFIVDISDTVAESTVVAEVNGQLWDMHRPLEQDCKLKLLTMKSRDETLFQVIWTHLKYFDDSFL